MKISTRILMVVSAFFILLACIACTKESAENDAVGKAVRTLVETYCKADFDGAMLSSANYRKSPLPAFVVAGEKEGPAWDTVALVKAYSIKSVEIKGEDASVNVLYEVLGEMPGAQKVEIKKRNENYTFKLKKKNGDWKLIRPFDLMPHIGVDTAIRHMQKLYESEKNSQPNAPNVIEQLNKLKLIS